MSSLASLAVGIAVDGPRGVGAGPEPPAEGELGQR
jgi:hypothetical protein